MVWQTLLGGPTGILGLFNMVCKGSVMDLDYTIVV